MGHYNFCFYFAPTSPKVTISFKTSKGVQSLLLINEGGACLWFCKPQKLRISLQTSRCGKSADVRRRGWIISKNTTVKKQTMTRFSARLGPETSLFLSILSLNAYISTAILCWDVYFWSKIRVKTRMSKIPFSLSPKSTWRVWNQWRGTHSVWQCLPFIYLLCAMQALAPSSISLAHELLLLSLSPMHTIYLSLPLSSLSLSPTYTAARICFAFQSRRSHLEWSWKTIIHTETKHIQADSTAFEKR